MEQQAQNQPAQVPPPVQPAGPAPQAPQAAPVKKSNVWLWIIGGCLGIVILGLIIFGVLGWLAARKIKNEIKENIPFEELQKSADEWSKNAEELQKQAEEMQNSLPDPEDFPIPAGDNSLTE